MRKYAICGLSNRALGMFIRPLLNEFSTNNQIVALLDFDRTRFINCKQKYPHLNNVDTYGPNEFEQMIKETEPDVLIVASRDDTHVDYIIKGLKHDLDVITEKPMVTTVEDAKKVLKAEAISKGKVTVTFNYRYSPIHRKIKELLLENKIGRITSIDLNWYIDTYHGASYFKRWNRKREHSGGLSIHKSTHHFDLVNWWLNQNPVEVFAYGALNYYGSEGELNPLKEEDNRFCGTCHVKEKCDYYMRWSSRSETMNVEDDHYKQNEMNENQYTNYRPDACIFDSEINIEDTYTATVKYDKGALLSYSINFSLPYEGYRLAINGTKGRIETQEFHAPSRVPFPVPEQTIEYFPLFGSKEIIHVVHTPGGHGGGDPILLEDIFLGPDPRRSYEILAGTVAGAYSIATGEAVWRSVKEKTPIKIESMLQLPKEEVNTL